MSTELRKVRPVDGTTYKTNRIEYLQRQVNDASTVVAKADSKYKSFVEKANTFTELYNEAEADLQTAEGYWKLFLQVKSDLEALKETANEANLIAVDVQRDIRQLIIAWEEVTADTLKAAEAIVLTARYIQKRKASNPLISNDLVKDATAAAKAAEKTVAAVVKAFKAALSTLSSSAQANNSTALTNVYINLAMTALIENKSEDGKLPKLLSKLLIDEEIPKGELDVIKKWASNKKPLEESLKDALKEAKSKDKRALMASEQANKEMNKAKEELALAQATLATWEAALLAAKTAVAG